MVAKLLKNVLTEGRKRLLSTTQVTSHAFNYNVSRPFDSNVSSHCSFTDTSRGEARNSKSFDLKGWRFCNCGS